MIKNILPGLADLIFPRNCTLCRSYHPRTAEDPLCPECFAKLPFNRPPFCLKCSRRLESYSDEGLCPDCRRHPPAFDYAWAATVYADPLSSLIPHYKFHNKTALRTTFGKIIREFLVRYDIRLSPDVIVPVPLHPARLRERGYNQAALIAERLAPVLGAPVAQSGLERARHTPRQSELGQKERFTNVIGAFRITTPSRFMDKHVILVDDLLTTGSTASEAAKVLKAAGAAKVGVLTLAIA